MATAIPYPANAFAATMAGIATTRERERVRRYVDGLLAEVERQKSRADSAQADFIEAMEQRDAWKGRVCEADELANSYASTNETQRQRIEELLARLAEANRRAEAAEAERDKLRKEAKIMRQLLLGAALDSIYENLLGMDQSLPPLAKLSEEIKAYWSGLIDVAGQSGAVSVADEDAIDRIYERLTMTLPQYPAVQP